MIGKEEVIHQIGEDNWDAFEDFMFSKQCEYDENGFEIYYVGDVAEFKQSIKKI